MKYIAIATVALLIFLRAGLANPPRRATTNPAESQMQKWWDDLEKREPECSRALLQFADYPAESVAFFAERLKPLKITEDEVKSLISDLESDDKNVWKPAFDKMQYFDPRLAIDLSTLMTDNVKPRSRNRLVAILCSVNEDVYAGKSIKLRFADSGYNFVSDDIGSWWAEHRIEHIGSGTEENFKPQWVRACRAIVLLEHIGSPEAITILRDMATGHPDAKPTKAAAEALENIQALRK
jgi:hypothetical protein